MTLAAAFNQFKFDFIRPAAEAVSNATYKNDANSPYKILGVRRNATMTEIKRAWRKLMMTNHPDLGGSVEMTMSINGAYKEICRNRGGF